MNNTEEEIAELLLSFREETRLVAQQRRAYLKKETRPAIEMVLDSYNSLNIGYGFTKRPWDCYCGIIVYSKHINISFPSGALLTDPGKLLHRSTLRLKARSRFSNAGWVYQVAATGGEPASGDATPPVRPVSGPTFMARLIG